MKIQNRLEGTIIFLGLWIGRRYDFTVTEQYLVLTPEKVIVSYRLAGIGSRILAHIVDLVIFLILFLGASYAVTYLAVFAGVTLSYVALSLLSSFGIFLYFLLQEGLWQGQTIGKKALNLRVISADGTPITFISAFYRTILRPGDFLPMFYMVGFITIFTNEKSQRLGDLAAGTIVIHDPRVPFGFTPAPHRYGQHPFEASIGPLLGMTLEEYFALKRLCDRFPELTPAAQTASISEIWNPFAESQKIVPLENVHPIYQIEAVIMKFGRQHNLV